MVTDNNYMNNYAHHTFLFCTQDLITGFLSLFCKVVIALFAQSYHLP